jgi:hypothetical protein
LSRANVGGSGGKRLEGVLAAFTQKEQSDAPLT